MQPVEVSERRFQSTGKLFYFKQLGTFLKLCILLFTAAPLLAQPGEDLVVDEGATLSETTVGQDETVTVSYRILNQGTAAVTVDFRDDIYLSNDAELDAGDVFLRQSFLHSVDVPPGSRTSLHNRDVEIPFDTVPGEYFILVEADGDDVVAEGDETNNVDALPVTVVERFVDLVVDGDQVTLGATRVGAGEILTVTSRIQNIGDKTSDTAFRDGFFLSTDTVLDESDPLLRRSINHTVPIEPGGRTGLADRDLTIPLDTVAGAYYILAQADDQDVVLESDETNNVTVSAPFTITISDEVPDIVIADGNVDLSRPTVTRGGTVDVIYQLENAGEITSATPFRDDIVLSLDETLDAGDTLLRQSFLHSVPIEPGGRTSEHSREVTIPLLTVAGNYFILVEADGDNAVEEENETNNVVSVPIQILPFDVAITQPATGFLTQADQVDVSGNMSETVTSVQVNGIAATISGETYLAADVPLVEGTNRLVVTARGENDQIVTLSVSGRRDTDPPFVVIESPSQGDRTIAERITIAGTVNDIIPGSTVNEDDVTVRVNGVPTPVANRTFMVEDMALALGTNTLTVDAVDRAGNPRSTSIQIIREENPSGIMVEIVQGNNQSASIGTDLPTPLVARVVDASGAPIVGRVVKFTVSNGDGVIGDPANLEREISLLTDAAGEATTTFRLGTRTGQGFHRVLATTPGSLSVAEFCTTATAGIPVQMAKVRQPPARGPANQPLADPLSVLLTDSKGNPVSGVAVEWSVDFGGGQVDGIDGGTTTFTNPDGVAEAAWTLGPFLGPGANQITATYAGNTEGPLSFTVEGVEAGVGATSVSGVVQGSTGEPVAGTQVVIRNTALSAVTDADGRFEISGVDPGGHHLGVLGSTAGDFPDIFFAVEVLAGLDNPMEKPVVLPTLDLSNAQLVGGDEDVSLTMNDVEGFEITILANSVVFPDGSRGEITMSLSQVKFDKVPMEPPMGSTPRVVGTLQPSGYTFDPPARVTFPNTSGLAPGDVADVFQFHHDLGQFVNVGPGTVSEDGDVVSSDPGFGLVESGWHCLIRRPGPRSRCANGCSAYLFGALRDGRDLSVRKAVSKPPVRMCVGDTTKVTVGFFPRGGTFDAGSSWTSSEESILKTGAQQIGVRRPDLTSVDFSALTPGTVTVTSPLYRVPVAGLPDITCEMQFCSDTLCDSGSVCIAAPEAVRLPAGTILKNGAMALNERCTVLVGNVRGTVTSDGKFVVDDIPTMRLESFNGSQIVAVEELVKARATCVDTAGNVTTGQSDFFTLNPESTAVVGEVFPSALDPIPGRIRIQRPKFTLEQGESMQLGVTGFFSGGSTRDMTARAEGTTYFSASRWVGVDENGVVTNQNTTLRDRFGMLMAFNQGNVATTFVRVKAFDNDKDNDGLRDDWETLHGLDTTRNDASEDLDGDGLTNLQEQSLGTVPTNADTDGDLIADGIDGSPLRPLGREAESLKIIAPDASSRDFFGDSVAIDGDRIVAGAPEHDGVASAAGQVYVFSRASGIWNLETTLTASDAGLGDFFGDTVALEGNRLAVAATGQDDQGSGTGAVYVYERNETTGTWSESARLTASDGDTFDSFGAALALDGDRLAVGVPGRDDAGNGSGAVYVFERDAGGVWFEAAKLLASDGAANDLLGSTVALSGDTLLAAAPSQDAAGFDSGAVYVFERDTVTGTWSESAKLTAADTAAGDSFGSSIAIAGTRLILGASFDDEKGLGTGAAYVFERDTAGGWVESAKLVVSDAKKGQLLGSSAGLLENRIYVGASFAVHGTVDSGATYVFEEELDGSWIELKKLVPSLGRSEDELGAVLSISADGLIVVGAPKDDTATLDAGAIYLY